MSKRPNWGNKVDACCRCAKLLPTPADHGQPAEGELRVWQPESTDPPQWICAACEAQLTIDARRDS
jgi:hypothetical protein